MGSFHLLYFDKPVQIYLGSLLAQDRYAEDAQRSHELGSEWAKYPQPELMTWCSLYPSSVHPRRQVVRRHVVQRARRECWEICCGNGGLAAAFSDHGLVGHGVDKERGKLSQQASASPKKKFHEINVLDEKFFNWLCQRMGQGIILYMHFGLNCSSFSVLRARSRTTSRSSRQPWGSESFPGEADGKRMAESILKLISICENCNVFRTVEISHSSMVWKLSHFFQLSEKPHVGKAVVDQCMFGLKDAVSENLSETYSNIGMTSWLGEIKLQV